MAVETCALQEKMPVSAGLWGCEFEAVLGYLFSCVEPAYLSVCRIKPNGDPKGMKRRCEGERDKGERTPSLSAFSICKLMPVSVWATWTKTFMFCRRYLTQVPVPPHKPWLMATATCVQLELTSFHASDTLSIGLSPDSPSPSPLERGIYTLASSYH